MAGAVTDGLLWGVVWLAIAALLARHDGRGSPAVETAVFVAIALWWVARKAEKWLRGD